MGGKSFKTNLMYDYKLTKLRFTLRMMTTIKVNEDIKKYELILKELKNQKRINEGTYTLKQQFNDDKKKLLKRKKNKQKRK